MELKVRRSQTGLPVIAESGGGMSNTGEACVICGAKGEKVKPLFVPKGYSNREHALFVARAGMCIVSAWHNRGGEGITISRIMKVGTQEDPDLLVLEEVGSFQNGDGNIPKDFSNAATMALEKSKTYHCREAMYIL
jgi:hypothetical protein